MPKRLIVANWKMEPQTLYDARRLLNAVKKTASKLRGTQTIVCPPFVYLSGLLQGASSSHVALGGQDVYSEFGGAYTGEISPDMLKNLGVTFVIVGHSERRALGESDQFISQKVKAAMSAGLRPILCVGEKERDKDAAYLHVLKEQIKKSLSGVSKKDIAKVIIAYEPVWAVGAKGRGADTPESTLEVVIFIKKVLADMFGKEQAMKTPILYGGSVNNIDAGGFLTHGGVSGLLVGRASLNAAMFREILTIAESV